MIRIVLALIAAAGFAMPANAEITNTAPNGFTVKHQASVQATPDDIWANLIAPSRWWSGAHSWSGNAENFYLVPQAGGCFCELIRKTSEDNIKSSSGSVQHMRVIFVNKNETLRMSGALGPLQGEALSGTLTIELKPDGDATVVQFTYKVGGYMEFPMDQIAPAVDGVIGEQLTRLAALFASDIESESASDAAPAPNEDEN
ncbi:SRPBCC family protein [Parasphingorhabdus halotolerans]|uniref:SRPBCC family protein n=1 Tax=Parasphingorhabdus halotolerans TaxID=2725558 RepID=A0A6H2DM49_9SPHN|nr:SRPBCC family protein [Parasphingorhabdus halotolerans]QJB69207.1 SRPBCC family protein [Parasphingorhabdus halotolerans]